MLKLGYFRCCSGTDPQIGSKTNQRGLGQRPIKKTSSGELSGGLSFGIGEVFGHATTSGGQFAGVAAHGALMAMDHFGVNPIANFARGMGRSAAGMVDSRFGYKNHVVSEYSDSNGNRVPHESHFNTPSDPAKSPGKGWEWRGGENGAWHNPTTRHSLRPDLNHPKPIGPHWDLKQTKKIRYRIYPDGAYERKY